MWPTWSRSGAVRTQVGPMLAPWILLSGLFIPFVVQSIAHNLTTRNIIICALNQTLIFPLNKMCFIFMSVISTCVQTTLNNSFQGRLIKRVNNQIINWPSCVIKFRFVMCHRVKCQSNLSVCTKPFTHCVSRWLSRWYCTQWRCHH